jgi:hypothetical protein
MRASTYSLLLLALLPASGCTVQIGGLAGGETTSADPFTWGGALQAGQTVEIKGINGGIRAVSSSSDRVEVRAERRARRSDPGKVEIRVVEHAGGVTVCAVYPRRGNSCQPGSGGRLSSSGNDTRVEFTVSVPADVQFVGRTTNGSVTGDGVAGPVRARTTNGTIQFRGAESVHASTTNGDVRVEALGPVTASTTNGSIRATVSGGAQSEPMALRTTNGSITLYLPTEFGAQFEARTTTGAISTDFPIRVQGRIDRRRLAGTLGDGGESIRLRTTNGSISLKRHAASTSRQTSTP